MKNTMDSILVRYGDYDKDPCSLLDFLQKKDLNPTEQQGQRALAELYKLNQKHNIFEQGFPMYNGNPLLVDFMPVCKENTIAFYDDKEHAVHLSDIELSDSRLVTTLAHELKHAEQTDERLRQALSNPNLKAFQKHQFGFLQEAQAFACESRVASLMKQDTIYSRIKLTSLAFGEDLSEKELEQKIMAHLLPNLYRGSYKNEYDRQLPIKDTDIGLEHFPSSLNVGPDVKKVIDQAPKKAKTVPNQIRQAFENGRENEIVDLLMIKDIKGDIVMTPEKTKELCEDLLRSDSNKSKKLLKYILTAQDKNGNFIVDSGVAESIMYWSASKFMLSDVADLFSVKCKSGQTRISEEYFRKLSDKVKNGTDAVIAIFSKMSPKKHQKNLEALDIIQKSYANQTQNNGHMLLAKISGRD